MGKGRRWKVNKCYLVAAIETEYYQQSFEADLAYTGVMVKIKLSSDNTCMKW